jgi:hypothetical protein
MELKMLKTIEPDIQEKIIDILPNDGPLALKVMAQLSANILLEVKGAELELFIKDIQDNFEVYRAEAFRNAN